MTSNCAVLCSVMREQLANTDDIRRVRKKAPCTQRELWAVQRHSLGPQIFSEPSIAGECCLWCDKYIVDAKFHIIETCSIFCLHLDFLLHSFSLTGNLHEKF